MMKSATRMSSRLRAREAEEELKSALKEDNRKEQEKKEPRKKERKRKREEIEGDDEKEEPKKRGRGRPSKKKLENSKEALEKKENEVPEQDETEKGKEKEKEKSKDDPEEERQCGICYENISVQGVLETCKHVFCFKCINKWSKTSNTCPFCKQRFESIEKIPLSRRSRAKREVIKVSFRDPEVIPNFLHSQERGIIPLTLLFLLPQYAIHPVSLSSTVHRRSSTTSSTVIDLTVDDQSEAVNTMQDDEYNERLYSFFPSLSPPGSTISTFSFPLNLTQGSSESDAIDLTADSEGEF